MSAARLFFGLAVVVVVNAAVTVGLARARVGTDKALVAFAARVLLNAAMVGVARVVLGSDQMDIGPALFFVVMLSLITLLHDRYTAVHPARVSPPSPRLRPLPSGHGSRR